MDFNTIQSLQEAYSQVHETMVRGGGPKPSAPDRGEDLFGNENPKTQPKPESKPQSTPAPAAPAKPQLSQRAQAILSGNSVFSRDPRARANFDPRYDKKPSAPSTSTSAPKPTETSAPKPPSSGTPSTSAPKSGGGILGSLDKFARDTAGKVGGEYGAKKGRETLGNIFGIPEREGRRRGTEEGQRIYDKAKETIGGFLKQDYEPDAFDIVLEYLVAEGYADTNKSALAIMANMSEEWKQSIVEGVRPGEVKKPLNKAEFKKRRRSLAGREASDDAKKRGHVDKFTGKPYGTEEAASRRKDIHSPEHEPEREARRKFAEDPD